MIWTKTAFNPGYDPLHSPYDGTRVNSAILLPTDRASILAKEANLREIATP